MAAWHGNGPGQGPGHGGPARGAGTGGPAKAFTVDSPRALASDTNADLETQVYRAEQRRKNRERREKAWQTIDEIVDDKAHPARFHAARETLNRLDGMPTQKTELTGADGAAVKIEAIRRVIVDPRNPDA